MVYNNVKNVNAQLHFSVTLVKNEIENAYSH